MQNQSDQQVKEERALQLDRLVANLKEARVLQLQAEERLAIEQAVERAHAQLVEDVTQRALRRPHRP